MRNFLIRYQIIIFLVLTLIFSWYPWYTGGHGFKVWGPSLAGLVVVATMEGRNGLGKMFRRLVYWRVGLVWWGVAFLGPVVLTLAAVLGHILTGGPAPGFTFWKREWHMAPILMLVLLLPLTGGPGGEEPFGWRGYLQPSLQGKWGPFLTSVVVGIAWAVWHLPEFYNPASTQYAAGIRFFIPMAVMWISASILMTWIYHKTGGSVLLSGVIFHLMLDVSSATLLADFTMAGMTEGIPPLNLRLVTFQIAVFALAASALLILTKGRLGFSPTKGIEEKSMLAKVREPA